jgi:hypothetical protein
MAYRQSELGLLVRLDPKKAKTLIETAYRETDDGKEGRAYEKAAAKLDVAPSTLKRIAAQLEDLGMPIKHYTKRPAGDPAAIPGKMAKRKRKKGKKAA